MIRILIAIIVLMATCNALCQENAGFGHSHMGTAFDSGLRSKPWKFDGLGSAPFPISIANDDLQSWYDQGNELLHSFWFEEAERSFRWCLKMEPENAMVYFGLARCGLNWFSIGGDYPELKRFREFLKEAVKRKDRASLRERLYIEAWDAAYAKTGEDARKVMIAHLQKLCLLFPDDIEAKCHLAFYNIGQGSQLANEHLIQQVLKSNPMHPGAHHARIHNWDDVDGAQAIASCELYGKAAPGVGHALHMPGHVYAGIGMWHEAAIAMDSATRVELKHMNERLAMPFENWNYPHNRDYLSYIQEQVGRLDASIQGSRDILNSPKDPEIASSDYPALIPMVRALLKFGLWERILDDEELPSASDPFLDSIKVAARVIALAELGRASQAREALMSFNSRNAAMLEEEIAKTPDQAATIRKMAEDNEPLLFRVAEAKVLIAEGKRPEALKILLKLAEREKVARETHMYSNDPPSEPWPILRIVGDEYLSSGDCVNAIDAYQRALGDVENDAWCLAGLAKAYAAQGNIQEAKRFAGRFLAVWRSADSDLNLMKEVKALNLNATPTAETFKPERTYVPMELEKFGPSNWQPFAAPELNCLDISGKLVRLSSFKGKNVVLVFYLSDQCVHCMEQLSGINERIKEFGDLNTVVLGVSSTTPAANKASTTLAPFAVTLLSDTGHVNARRFSSYDDFEDMELHSTILIDAQGRVRWKRTGGDPFGDVDFLLREIKRWKS